MPSHGKSAWRHTYPKYIFVVGDHARKNACSRDGSIRCVVNPPEEGAFVNTRRSSRDPSGLGRSGQSKSCSSRVRDLVAGTSNWVRPFSRNGGPSVTCCVQATGRSYTVALNASSLILTRSP